MGSSSARRSYHEQLLSYRQMVEADQKSGQRRVSQEVRVEGYFKPVPKQQLKSNLSRQGSEESKSDQPSDCWSEPRSEPSISDKDFNWYKQEVERLNKLQQELQASLADIRKEMQSLPQSLEQVTGSCTSTLFYRRALDNLAQGVWCLDSTGRLSYWNRFAQHQYGWLPHEVVGKNGPDVLVPPEYRKIADAIHARVVNGEPWSGHLPLQARSGEHILTYVTTSPIFDEEGRMAGTCVAAHAVETCLEAFGGDLFQTAMCAWKSLAQSLQTDKATTCSSTHESSGWSLWSTLKSLFWKTHSPEPAKAEPDEVWENAEQCCWDVGDKMKVGGLPEGVPMLRSETGVSTSTYEVASTTDEAFGWSSPGTLSRKTTGGDLSGFLSTPSPPSADEQETNPNRLVPAGQPETAMSASSSFTFSDTPRSTVLKKHASFPGADAPDLETTAKLGSKPSLNVELEASEPLSPLYPGEPVPRNQTDSDQSSETSNQADRSSPFSLSPRNKHGGGYSGAPGYEIPWESITKGEEIGRGVSGTVYHGQWHGSDVAVKVFPLEANEITPELLAEFRKEVAILQHARHPNIVLFMGAITSPPLAIVTEVLPRGSLYRLLHHRPAAAVKDQMPMSRRVKIALDVARGMSYLHNCSPPIVHRDLKSPNILVDKNWTAKVGDFGLSRAKNGTYVSCLTAAGTPEWMAPEVLRSEPSNEKSDIWSFGVILWELVTLERPWGGYRSGEIVGLVGFQGEKLPLPTSADPALKEIINKCFASNPQERPTFDDIVKDLKVCTKSVGAHA